MNLNRRTLPGGPIILNTPGEGNADGNQLTHMPHFESECAW